jgi:HPt (histidine-containing phosphotransfer) domain-containing protein
MPSLTSSDDAIAPILKQIGRFLPRFAQRDARAADVLASALRKLRALLVVLPIDEDVARKLNNRTKRAIARRAVLTGVRNAVRQSSAALDADRLRKKTSADVKRICERFGVISPGARDLSQPAASQRLRASFLAEAAQEAAVLQQALTDAGTVFLVDRLRPLRRSIHRMRDEVRPFAGSSPAFGLTEFKALDRATDLLDRIRDVRRLIKRVRDTQKTLTPPDLHAWHQLDSLIISLEGRSRRLHARLLRERPTLIRLCVRLAARPVAARARRKAS